MVNEYILFHFFLLRQIRVLAFSNDILIYWEILVSSGKDKAIWEI